MFNLHDSMLRGARLEAVAKQVAAASGPARLIYVERRGNLYRWSLTHRGGPYPLLRETAKLLGIEYHTIILPFRTLPTGLAIVDAEPMNDEPLYCVICGNELVGLPDDQPDWPHVR